MPNDPQDGALPEPVVEFVKGPQYASFYSNNVSYSVNQLDFVLVFGETIEIRPEKLTIEQRARITMNPLQAKVLSILLNEQIDILEKNTGKEIEVPEGMLQRRKI